MVLSRATFRHVPTLPVATAICSLRIETHLGRGFTLASSVISYITAACREMNDTRTPRSSYANSEGMTRSAVSSIDIVPISLSQPEITALTPSLVVDRTLSPRSVESTSTPRKFSSGRLSSYKNILYFTITTSLSWGWIFLEPGLMIRLLRLGVAVELTFKGDGPMARRQIYSWSKLIVHTN